MAKPLYSLFSSVKKGFSNKSPDGNPKLYGEACTALFEPNRVWSHGVGLNTWAFLESIRNA